MNPPNPNILDQVEGHWQKLMAMALWKLVGRDKAVVLSMEDIREFNVQFAPEGGPVLITHGHVDSIEFKVVSMTQATIMAAQHENSNVKKR